MELHLWKPGEREYVAEGELLARSDGLVRLFYPSDKYKAEEMKIVLISGSFDDDMMPPLVNVFQYSRLVGKGYYRILGNVVDIVLT